MVRCPSQIRAGFFRQERLSHRTVHGNYLDYVRAWGKKKGLYSKMLKKAYGKMLDDETLDGTYHVVTQINRWHAVLRTDKAERERYAHSAIPRLPMDMHAVGTVVGYTSRAPAECREVSSDATSIGRRE